MSRRPLVLATATAAGLVLLAAPATPSARAADTVDVQVPNGTFAQPVAPDNGTAAGHTDWSPDNTGVVFGKALAQHPRGYQAAALNWNGAALTMRTRLWGGAGRVGRHPDLGRQPGRRPPLHT
ncbi:hypothetical protein AB0I39_00600 [Kitasatospora purpeofusca]|uniref:hypothetical protein n=1 Tax=Kitasatospora purpeofusca TaxID=67352 RepID=UPI003404C15C